MYSITFLVLLALLVCDTSSVVVSSSSTGVTKIGTSSTQFGVNLYNEILKGSPITNVFVSPVSISLALSMVLLGARGKAMIEFCRFLFF